VNNPSLELRAIAANTLGTLLGNITDAELQDMIRQNFYSVLGTILVRVG